MRRVFTVSRDGKKPLINGTAVYLGDMFVTSGRKPEDHMHRFLSDHVTYHGDKLACRVAADSLFDQHYWVRYAYTEKFRTVSRIIRGSRLTSQSYAALKFHDVHLWFTGKRLRVFGTFVDGKLSPNIGPDSHVAMVEIEPEEFETLLP